MTMDGNNPYFQPSFSVTNRVARFIWSIVDLLFFRFSPRPFHLWRAFLLRVFGAELGSNVHIYPGVRIWAPWNLVVSDNVGVGEGVVLYNISRITLGRYSVVSQGAYLCTGSHDIDSANFQLISAPIVIGEYCWVCAESFVGPGVTLAEGVVLGARSVASKNVIQSWAVFIGNPIVFKRYRNSAIIRGRA